MLSKTYAAQPYEVGPKNRKKSLVVGIPSKIAEACNINTSTIFAIQLDDRNKTIILQMIHPLRQNVAASFEADSNQVSGEVQ